MLPCAHKIYKAAVSDIGIKSFYKFGALGRYSPVAFAGLTGSAKMTSERKKCGCRNVAGVGAESDGFDYVCRASYASSDNKRNIVSYSLVTQSLVD